MNILCVEDDPGLGVLLKKHLQLLDHRVTLAESIATAELELSDTIPALLICDHQLPDGEGLDLLQSALKEHPELPCIMLTGHGSESLAVAAMKAGARDYLVKDIENNFLSMLTVVIDRIQEEKQLVQALENSKRVQSRLEASNRYLSTSLKRKNHLQKLVGQSACFKKILATVEQVAPTPSSVLITGETGTGKDMVAELIHALSSRSDKPLISVNSAALPRDLMEVDLFGRADNLHRGATGVQVGRFEAAHGGTLYLDEIGVLGLDVQPKLLRFLQEATLQRVGSDEKLDVDVRVIAATNEDLLAKMKLGEFREDLYYRLNVIPIHLPPLRERGSDIELLFMHFVHKYSARHQLVAPDISESILQRIRNHLWPGNVRELNNYVERSIVTQHWGELGISSYQSTDTANAVVAAENEQGPLEELSAVEQAHILRVLRHTQGVISGADGAAKILGMHPNTLRSRMLKLGIERSGYEVTED